MSSERERPRPSSRPRWRYLLFEVKGAPTRMRITELIRRAFPAPGPQARLTRFDGSLGVLQTRREDMPPVRAEFEKRSAAAGFDVKALLVSGTLAALERRRPALRGSRGR